MKSPWKSMAITVANQHLETHMPNPPKRTVPLIYTAVTVAAVALAVVGGTSAASLIVGLRCVFTGLALTAAGLGLGVVRLLTRPAPGTPA